MKRRIVLGFSFALLLLLVLIAVIGSREIVAELSKASPRVLSLAFLSGLGALLFRGLVWERFIGVVDETMPRRQIIQIFLTVMFVKYATPYGQLATEPFAAYLVSRDSEMAYEGSLASILSADLLNYIPYYTFGFLALGVLAVDDISGTDMQTQIVAFTGLFVVIVSVVYVAVRRSAVVYRLVLASTGLCRRVVGRVTTRFDEQLSPTAVRSRLDGFYTTVGTITADRRTLVFTAVYAHLGMVCLMLPVYIGALALGYQLALPVVALVVALGKLGAIVPAPGGTGGVEVIVTAGLTTLGGLEPAAAVTIALIYRASTYWLTLGIGGLSTAKLLVGRPSNS
ncbi:lysylphosphatidylglycerol synthase transmembrane domain-containing protein [Natronorubrum sulfidifaciens]|uniref:Uncharacterized protein n=1 Tax=Natronorubrum sulfidifaciens JCM 14089 TaxID=1230460 RepID=L9VZH8_9EURY|nr:lysylphosphatidylglycerol synthase transmembrane domain-containing protein [Natronorubrum sulfidifaciens]ELY42472.1 hypothetical protein C495_14182 [Natronorubrum sulfidifaciens JCM 14089]